MLKGLTLPRLYMIDACGAAITAFALEGIRTYALEASGVSAEVLRILAAIAMFLALYSSLGNILKIQKSICLSLLIATNVSYCLLTAFLILVQHPNAHWLMKTYVLAEIAIILFLVRIEILFRTRLNE